MLRPLRLLLPPPNRMKFPKKFLLFLLFFQIHIFVAESRQTFGQYHFDHWTTDDGLPQNGVRKIAQTPDGYLWFTTFDGLARFDGVNFTTFNKANTKGILNNRFTNIYADQDGTLYATTMEDGILTVYRDGIFSTYDSEQVPGNYIQDIKIDENGEARFLSEDEDRTSKSWYYLRDENFVFIRKVLPKEEKAIVLKGNSGATWTVTATETTELRDGKIIVYPLNLADFARASVFEDREGTLWIGANSVHRLRNGSIKSYTERDGFPPTSVYHSFWEGADGSLWFATGGFSTSGFGLVQYRNEQMNFWRDDREEFAKSSISKVFQDREGTIWLATDKGLSKLKH